MSVIDSPMWRINPLGRMSSVGQGVLVTDMYAIASETANTNAFCVWPIEASAKSPASEADLG
jgi:hypothetical protein